MGLIKKNSYSPFLPNRGNPVSYLLKIYGRNLIVN